MQRSSRRARATATAILVMVASTAIVFTRSSNADTGRQQTAEMPKFRCYCECESNGKVCKMRFCELQKYETHAWAASCRKHAMSEIRANEEHTQPSPAHTSKNSHAVYTAQR